MLPVGQLMIEHRLIERVIRLWKWQLDKIERSGTVDINFISGAVEFMQSYADRCHHGKEEDILFRALNKKPLSAALSKILQELIDEHVISRKTVKELSCAKEGYLAKDKTALERIRLSVKTIVELYPAHIQKEDKHFFLPCMEYFTPQEKGDMMLEFSEFDRNLIHDKYKVVVKDLEHLHSLDS